MSTSDFSLERSQENIVSTEPEFNLQSLLQKIYVVSLQDILLSSTSSNSHSILTESNKYLSGVLKKVDRVTLARLLANKAGAPINENAIKALHEISLNIQLKLQSDSFSSFSDAVKLISVMYLAIKNISAQENAIDRFIAVFEPGQQNQFFIKHVFFFLEALHTNRNGICKIDNHKIGEIVQLLLKNSSNCEKFQKIILSFYQIHRSSLSFAIGDSSYTLPALLFVTLFEKHNFDKKSGMHEQFCSLLQSSNCIVTGIDDETYSVPGIIPLLLSSNSFEKIDFNSNPIRWDFKCPQAKLQSILSLVSKCTEVKDPSDFIKLLVEMRIEKFSSANIFNILTSLNPQFLMENITEAQNHDLNLPCELHLSIFSEIIFKEKGKIIPFSTVVETLLSLNSHEKIQEFLKNLSQIANKERFIVIDFPKNRLTCFNDKIEIPISLLLKFFVDIHPEISKNREKICEQLSTYKEIIFDPVVGENKNEKGEKKIINQFTAHLLGQISREFGNLLGLTEYHDRQRSTLFIPLSHQSFLQLFAQIFIDTELSVDDIDTVLVHIAFCHQYNIQHLYTKYENFFVDNLLTGEITFVTFFSTAQSLLDKKLLVFGENFFLLLNEDILKKIAAKEKYAIDEMLDDPEKLSIYLENAPEEISHSILDISKNTEITSEKLEPFKKVKMCETIFFTDCIFPEPLLINLGVYFPHLQIVQLINCSLHTRSISLALLDKLQLLELSGCTNKSLDLLICPNHSMLRSLKIHDCQELILDIDEITGAQNLALLSISGKVYFNKNFFATVHKARNLSELSLVDCLDPTQAELFSVVQTCPNLTKLVLEKLNISSASLKKLLQIADFSKIVELNIKQCNGFTLDIFISIMPRLVTVKKLDFSNCTEELSPFIYNFIETSKHLEEIYLIGPIGRSAFRNLDIINALAIELNSKKRTLDLVINEFDFLTKHHIDSLKQQGLNIIFKTTD